MRHPLLNGRWRYQFGGQPDRPKIPKVPDPLPQVSTLTQQAQGAGQRERKRLAGRRGSRGTIFAGRRDLTPARTSGAQLKQKLGGADFFRLRFGGGL